MDGEGPYIEPFENDFSLSLALRDSSAGFLRNTDDSSYSSNRPLEAAVTVGWKSLSLEFGYFLPRTHNSSHNKSSSFDFQLNYYDRKFFSEIQWKDYSGFYEDSGGDAALRVQSIGVLSQYVWNYEELSLKASFGLQEKQLRSAGSFLLGGSAFYQTAFSDDENFRFSDRYSRKKKFLHAGPAAGYAHTWVSGGNLFFALLFSVGVNFGKEFDEAHLFLAPLAFLRFSLGYHLDDWSFSFSFMNSSFFLTYTTRSSSDIIMLGRVQLALTRRL
jgi:hypothetical protein